MNLRPLGKDCMFSCGLKSQIFPICFLGDDMTVQKHLIYLKTLCNLI